MYISIHAHTCIVYDVFTLTFLSHYRAVDLLHTKGTNQTFNPMADRVRYNHLSRLVGPITWIVSTTTHRIQMWPGTTCFKLDRISFSTF